MDLVLGLSMTSAAVRLVLVEGATGEGDTLDHDVIDIATAADANALPNNRVIAGAQRNTLHSIGVTWTAEAAADGAKVLKALANAGFEDFLAVSAWDAADALAAGIAGLAGCDDVGVCIVEPDAAVVAVVNPQRTLVDRIDRRFQGGDAAELVRALVPIFDPGDGTPEAIFVFGSAGDLSSVLSLLRSAVASPVVSAAEADLALARGAALAAARALSGWEARAVPPPASRPRSLPRRVPGVLAVPRKRMRVGKVGALTSVLAAAVLTFVVSLSLALTLDPTPQGDSSDPQAREVATAAGEPPMVAKAPVPSAPAPTHFGEAQSGPIPPPEAVPPPETVAAAPAPAPEAEPVYDAPEAAPAAPPPVYGPVETVPAAPAPEPVYVAPNTPVYTPPPPPRLRDRIIEKIPILNRFHEPQYP